ncbi:prephenate/arogenate dehydrogenase [Synechococcus sp. CS-602]|uniref:prephenate/arogenate dehydrogenase n=1 Tax=Synechococcaceae TaxID=1890426 RepID=UPI0008FF3CBF|nr:MULTISPECIES: prephenate/arogenate dehydrogenase [Synechococcaceae]MCT4364402.1 prephenate/arogenate dehydrogenase [Candidatus Regnicoccus frigidus MAG-AL1]APD49466.1 arogenate dehydrogenase [Synechococcus sp. SynAce01]MCT0201524.1 prephenate/arogenate dehydrogenase [Synechococcus sp. CS-603]MCT0206031.1 prephenate/arogenate dehydrogenase [Synechococcus sp. CS-602]MCT0244955.1 prephenate/arogenate dehydrogenase [Synechococcus sp. CS-601]
MTTLWRDQPVGLVGLGLIGGSIGLDLRAAGLEVRGWVHRQATAERASQRGLASQVGTDPAVLAGCGLVVLALPLDRLLDPAAELIAALPNGAVITDVGSVKGPVLQAWHGRVPRFVASHPMAGTAAAGVEAGQRDLFRGRPWVATPLADTDPEALAVVRELATLLAAQWLECAAAAHDEAVALISHLPVLVSAALLQAAERGSAAAVAGGVPALVRALASSGFADTTRVGGGNPELGTLLARCNREALLDALSDYRGCLEQLEGLVAQQRWAELEATLAACQQLRPPFLKP